MKQWGCSVILASTTAVQNHLIPYFWCTILNLLEWNVIRRSLFMKTFNVRRMMYVCTGAGHCLNNVKSKTSSQKFVSKQSEMLFLLIIFVCLWNVQLCTKPGEVIYVPCNLLNVCVCGICGPIYTEYKYDHILEMHCHPCIETGGALGGMWPHKSYMVLMCPQ